MQEVFENIIEKLESEAKRWEESGTEYKDKCEIAVGRGLRNAIEIVKQEAKQYNNGWIPCSERLPDYGERVLLQDFGGNITLEKCERKKGVKGFTDGNWWSSANNYLAWQPLPEKYQPKGE